MHYVSLINNVVADQAQIDPYKIFSPSYAATFMQAADEVTFGWVYQNGQFMPPPGPTPDEIQAENKAQAVARLQATDWVTQSDVVDPARFPHLLNQAEFLTYRDQLRGIAVVPPVTLITNWPPVPQEQWG